MSTRGGLSIKPVLNGAAFNQDSQCFSVAYDRGFRVYNSDPLEMWVSREFSEGGLAIATMLNRSNYLALVGGGDRPRYPQNKIIVWDDSKGKPALTLEFVLPVLNVLLSRKVIVAVFSNKVHVYSFATPPQLLASFDTAPNPRGIACIYGEGLIAVPGIAEGRVQIVSTDGSSCKVDCILRAHKAPLCTMALSERHLATASTTGTIVRVFDIQTQTCVREFRRGLDKANIWSIKFSGAGSQLALLSDKNTLHVFVLDDDGAQAKNRHHALASMPMAPKYFRNEWSFVSCQTSSAGPGVLGWTSEDSLVVIWKPTGRWEKYTILRHNDSPAADQATGHEETKGTHPQAVLVREAKRSIL